MGLEALFTVKDSETETPMITDGTRRIYGLDPDAGLTLEESLDAVHPDDRDVLAAVYVLDESH